MAHPDPSPHTGAAPPSQDSQAEQATLLGTLVHLWPYIWPSDRADLKMRVIWSVVLLLIAKLATLSVPFTFKWAIDALSGKGSAPIESSNWLMWAVASPLLMTAGYGALRVVMAILTQWRDGIFARVAMHAVRKLANITFVHMHELSLRFHLECWSVAAPASKRSCGW
jgi:ABC-type multidrug transport system fused ATPase/permease subunit